MHLHTTRTLHTGRLMPLMGLGTWQLTNDTLRAIAGAIELGYRMIDTSGDYGTQPGVGRGLQMSEVPRENLYIVTKVEENDDAYQATQHNLEELHLEYVDLMLIHRPPADSAGIELWKGLIRARRDGLTRDIGVSNYTEEQIREVSEPLAKYP